jgi:hypothetical protein
MASSATASSMSGQPASFYEKASEGITRSSYVQEKGEPKLYSVKKGEGKLPYETRKAVKKAVKDIDNDESFVPDISGTDEGKFAGETALADMEAPGGSFIVRARKEHQEETAKRYQATYASNEKELLDIQEQMKRLKERGDAITAENEELKTAKGKMKKEQRTNQLRDAKTTATDLGETPMNQLKLNDYLLVMSKLMTAKNE